MSQLNIPAKMTGVVVTSVENGGPAEAAGLQRGDVIQEVNHEVVKTLEDYQKASSALKKDEHNRKPTRTCYNELPPRTDVPRLKVVYCIPSALDTSRVDQPTTSE